MAMTLLIVRPGNCASAKASSSPRPFSANTFRKSGAITGEGHRRQVAELAGAIRTGRPLLTPGSEGRRSVALINAVYRSAETGSVVCMEP